ncbi:hypothetical protein JSY36_06060 [Bacillus sp. H-16]|uniref:hypothetical protein n=1 Tax=Alteribacter salitolerans TaxID=2912333 RepID=UPI001966877F|nr:hypothetical protein [Alteribacter salitolerans]MBM7095315.1 hypothetical protein [Alteribacter salitolerans]
MEQKKTNKSWLYGGVATGLAAGLIFFATNRNARTKVTTTFETISRTTGEWVEFIKENRESFVEHIRVSADRVASIVEEASDDIQTIVETSQQLKEHTFDILGTIQEAKEEFEELSSRLRGSEGPEEMIQLEEAAEGERKQLPPSDVDTDELKS